MRGPDIPRDIHTAQVSSGPWLKYTKDSKSRLMAGAGERAQRLRVYTVLAAAEVQFPAPMLDRSKLPVTLALGSDAFGLYEH